MYFNRRVKNSSLNKYSRVKFNIGVLIFVILVMIFFVRFVGVLKDNKERGVFVYV